MKRSEPKRMLRLPQVQQIIPYSTPHIYDLMKRGQFPRSVKIGANAVAWIEDEIIAWQERSATPSKPVSGRLRNDQTRKLGYWAPRNRPSLKKGVPDERGR
jgi:prophage regulatory protein